MVREHILISPASGHVNVSFTFKNHGPKVVTPIAFPEDNFNAGEDKLGFRFFRSYVDDKRVPTTRKQIPLPAENFRETRFWWTKNVPFGKGQTRRVRNLYQSEGGGNFMGIRTMSYTLATGATWKDNIQRATATIDFTGLPQNTAVSISPSGYELKGRVATWTWRNFKPAPDHVITVSWLPREKETKDSLEYLKISNPICFRLK